MRRIVLGCAAAAVVLFQAGCSQKPAAPSQAPAAATKWDSSQKAYIVTHIDVMPNFADGANQAIQKYAAGSRTEPGAISVEGLVQDGRPNHFTIYEVWQNRNALEAHGGQSHTREFRDTLQPMLGAPFDERLHAAMP